MKSQEGSPEKKGNEGDSGWYADGDFWNDFYPFLFAARAAGAEAQVAHILKLTGITEGRVLDMPCGSGLHAVHFAKRGFTVTGVDLDQRLLDRACKAAGDLRIEWIAHDMRTFRRPGAFDLAISMFTSLGYFDRVEEEVQVLAHMRESLAPGGLCLLEMVSREYLDRVFLDFRESEAPDGWRLEQRVCRIDDGRRVANDWTMTRGDERRHMRFEQTVFSGDEIRDLMTRAGFQSVTLYGNLEGAPYDGNATRLVAVGGPEKNPRP